MSQQPNYQQGNLYQNQPNQYQQQQQQPNQTQNQLQYPNQQQPNLYQQPNVYQDNLFIPNQNLQQPNYLNSTQPNNNLFQQPNYQQNVYTDKKQTTEELLLQKVQNLELLVQSQGLKIQQLENIVYSKQQQQIFTPMVQHFEPVPIGRWSSSSPHWKYYMGFQTDIPPQEYSKDGDKWNYFKSPNSKMEGAFPVYRMKCLIDPGQGYCYRVKPIEDNAWKIDGVCCYLLPEKIQGTIPIYLQSSTNPHRELLNASGIESSGWPLGKILGYAYPTK
jgi:hypothetical protein